MQDNRFERILRLIRDRSLSDKLLKKEFAQLTNEEIELIKIAGMLSELKGEKLSPSRKKILYEKISASIGINNKPYQLPFRKRFAVALAAVFLLSSTLVGIAAYNSSPKSPIYPVKETFYEVVSRVAPNTNLAAAFTEKQIRDYERALSDPELKKARRTEIAEKLKKNKEKLEKLRNRRQELRRKYDNQKKDKPDKNNRKIKPRQINGDTDYRQHENVQETVKNRNPEFLYNENAPFRYLKPFSTTSNAQPGDNSQEKEAYRQAGR